MDKRSLIAVAAAAIFVLIVAVWWGSRSPRPQKTGEPVVQENEKNNPPHPRATPAPGTADARKPQPAPPQEIPKWEMQIDQALRSNVNEAQTAQILIAMLPTLPPEGQVEAGHHISNLLPDENYRQVMPILLNTSMPEAVLSVFVTDLMNRGDSTKLPALLEIAKIPNHPFHDEAMSTLQIFLGEDYGNDWTQWKTAMDKYLAQHVAQPAN